MPRFFSKLIVPITFFTVSANLLFGSLELVQAQDATTVSAEGSARTSDGAVTDAKRELANKTDKDCAAKCRPKRVCKYAIVEADITTSTPVNVGTEKRPRYTCTASIPSTSITCECCSFAADAEEVESSITINIDGDQYSLEELFQAE